VGHAGVALDSVGPEQEDLWDHRGAFQAALDQAIAPGGERVEAVQATVHLKRRTKLSP